jgi:hypothetical protein
MKRNIFICGAMAIAFFYTSCSKSDFHPEKGSQLEETNLTAEQLHIRDSVIDKVRAMKPGENNLKSGPVVTIDNKKVNCNTFRLTVNVNQQICPSSPNSQLIAYWTLFDSKQILNLAPTKGNPCIQGTQLSFDYKVTGTDYLYIVLLVIDSKTGTVVSLFLSSTIILRPDC